MGIAAWALVISICAATTGVGSLAWQIVSWRRSGPEVVIPYAKIEVATRNKTNAEAKDDSYLELMVFNRGRSSVQIVHVFVSLVWTTERGRVHNGTLEDVTGLTTLNGGSQAVLRAPVPWPLMAAVKDDRFDHKFGIRLGVWLGNDTTAWAKPLRNREMGMSSIKVDV